MKKNRVGLAATKDNRIRFDALIAEMKSSGTKFPINQFNTPNLSKIAQTIGCTRDTLRKGSLSIHLAKCIADVGCESIENTKIHNEDSRLGNFLAKKDLNLLQKEIKSKDEQIKLLQIELDSLRSELNKSQIFRSEEELRFIKILNDGERFLL